ncbi:MAG: FecR family protein [Cyclobacteriaceae bacterium]|nr:FecR family protein [Cyclobacteriaceae bacterium HetDA_MAG_MS6]
MKRKFSEEELKQAWENSAKMPEALSKQESEAVFSALEQEIANRGNHRIFRKRALLAVAASISLLVITLLLLRDATTPLSDERPEIVVKRTESNQRSHFKLEDGTEVWLNADSRLAYRKVFGSEERRVDLMGEAYFKVAKDVKRPFRITTDESFTEVLGTEFNLSSYPGEEVSLAVTEGRVAFADIDFVIEPITLEAEELGHLNPSSGQLTKSSGVSVTYHRAWMMDKISFKQEKLDIVLAVLEKRYLTKIQVNRQKVEKCTIDITIEKQSLELIMGMISRAINGSYELLEDGSVVLTAHGCMNAN